MKKLITLLFITVLFAAGCEGTNGDGDDLEDCITGTWERLFHANLAKETWEFNKDGTYENFEKSLLNGKASQRL